MQRVKYHNRIRKRIALLLCAAMLGGVLPSCGKTGTGEVPELLEPAGITESYRPVRRRDIGDTSMLDGTVTAEAYPVFAEKPVSIYQLDVDPGDYVEAGDVIATGDTRGLDTQIDGVNRQLEELSLRRSVEETISGKTEEQLGWKKKAAEEAGLPDEAEFLDTEIRITRENLRYEKEQIDASVKTLKQELSKLQDEKKKLIFRAPHSGYVTFLMDISATNSVAQGENIAVISDYEDLYIEVPTVTSSYLYKDYQEKYILVEGQKRPVEEYVYTTKEMSYADTLSAYPYVRFHVADVDLEIGSTIPIYFAKKSSTNVISVEKDSVYREGNLYYCYVRTENGEQERRNLEVGATDSLYTEVLSGLSEGELVFYDNDSVLPVKYREYQVEAHDYTEEYYSDSIAMLRTEHDIYLSDYSGSLTGVKVSKGDSIEKGQELLQIEIPRGQGELAELKNEIADLERNHTNRLKALEQQEVEVKAAMEQAEKQQTEKKQQPQEKQPEQTGKKQEPQEQTEKQPEDPSADPQEEQSEEQPGDASEPSGEDPVTDGNRVAEVSEEDPAGQDSDAPSQEEKEALRDSLYVKEIGAAELEILNQKRKLENNSYSYQSKRLKDQLAEMNVGAATNGKVTIDAHGEGILGKIDLQENTSLYKGQYLFTANREGEKILRVNMPATRGSMVQTAAKPGQRIELRTETKTYTGTCIAVNGSTTRNYLFTRDGKERMTYSKPYADGQEEQFFVRLDDDSYYEDGMPNATASFRGRYIRGGITVPYGAVYMETDTVKKETVSYVWKVTDGGLMKQIVTVYESNLPGEERLILSGVDIGDVIAVE